MRQATQGVPAFSMLALIVWAGAVSIIPLLLLSWLVEGYDAWLHTWQVFFWTGAGSVIYLAYCATIVGYGLWGKLISRYPASVVSPLALLVPIVGLSSTSLFLGGGTVTLARLGRGAGHVGISCTCAGRKSESTSGRGRR